MEKTRTKKTAPDLAWFCVKPIGDVGDTQVPCLWLRWIDKR